MSRFYPPVFIIGYMAAGKTTFGRALAMATNRQFIDLDFYIQQRFRKSIPQIFAEKGEERFRQLEKAMLREAGMFENTIIACGGGTPCFFDNIDFMLRAGTVVYLCASIHKIVQRIVANNAARPLMAGKTREEIRLAVEKGISDRSPFYHRANISFNGDNLDDSSQIYDSVSKFLADYSDI